MIEAIGENDVKGGTSEIFNFTTTEVATASSPENNSEIPGTVISLNWNAIGASEYRVVVSKNSNLSSALIDKIVTEPKCIVGYDPGVFYWSVYSRDDYGNESDRSPVWSFTKKVTRQLVNNLFIKTDGSLWEWYSANEEPGKVPTDNDSETWKYVDSTNYSCCGNFGVSNFAIKNDDTLWGWGCNTDGQLGIGSIDDRINIPSLITTTEGSDAWECVSGGCMHVLGIKKSDHSLWAWGNNEHGQLGNNSTTNSGTPIKVLTGATDETWKYVSAGCFHSVGIKTDGTLWAWGYNSMGQIGDAKADDGGTYHDNRLSPIQIITGESPETWKTISAGGNDLHTPSGITLGIKTDGTLWAWSWYGQGQTTRFYNMPVKIDNGSWKDVAAGGLYSLAIHKDGSLWKINYGRYIAEYLFDTLKKMNSTDTWLYVVVSKIDAMMGFTEDGTCWRFYQDSPYTQYDWFE